MEIYFEPPSDGEIKDSILKELIGQLNIARVNSLSEINEKARRHTAKLIYNGDFANAFSGEELRGSFGIEPNQYKSRIADIIVEIANDTHIFSIPFKTFGTKMYGGWILAMGTDLFAKLKSSPAGITITKEGKDIPWLEWTLEIGNAIVIADFKVNFKLGKGRSGFANMIPDKVIGYRVPPQFAGTDYDNWITRDIIPHLDEYSEIILRTIDKYG